MTNKYQKALDKFCKQCYCGNCDNELEPCKEKELLQELVDLRKPKKLHFEYDGFADGYPVLDIAYCPNCGRFFEVDGEHFKNCPDCTQSLDWTIDVIIGVDWSEKDD